MRTPVCPIPIRRIFPNTRTMCGNSAVRTCFMIWISWFQHPSSLTPIWQTMRIPDEQLYVETFFPNYHKSDVVERDIGQVNPKIEGSSYTAEKNGEITDLYVSREEVIYAASNLDGYGGTYAYHSLATGLTIPHYIQSVPIKIRIYLLLASRMRWTR